MSQMRKASLGEVKKCVQVIELGREEAGISVPGYLAPNFLVLL